MANLDFGDLKGHTNVTKNIENLHSSISAIETLTNKLMDIKKNQYSHLNMYDKINFDLFTSYTLNTLYWMYLRTRGEDSNESDVKKELARIKEYMVTAKRVHERHTIRPRIVQEAAKRFVKHNIPNAKRHKPNN